MGELIEVKSAEQLEELGYTVDDKGIFVIGEENVLWMSDPEN